MIEEAQAQAYKGVLCQYCRQPIPVPAIVVSLEDEAQSSDVAILGGTPVAGHVFTLRCRSCDCEHPYRSKDIVNFEGTPKPRVSRAHQAKELRQSGKKARTAHA